MWCRHTSMAWPLGSAGHRCDHRGITIVVLVVAAILTSYDDVLVTADDVSSSALHTASKKLAQVDVKEWLGAILQQQFNATVHYSNSSPATVAGLFPAQVRVNFQGEADVMALRDDHVMADLSSLATLLTLGSMLEACLKGPLGPLPTANLVLALEGLAVFRSPSFGENHSALMAFWPVQSTGPADTWNTSSVNVVKGGEGLNPVLILQEAVTACKNKCPSASEGLQNIVDDQLCLQYFNESLSDNAKRTNFPPDVTSSFANLVVGALLHMGKDVFSSGDKVWKTNNANMSRLVDHVYEFSYQPLSSNASNNVIDNRMYYVMQEYLSQQASDALENASFVTCWIPQRFPGGQLEFGGKVMPTYNTIDPFATATFLYALTSALLHQMLDMDQVAKTLLTSNLHLMSWLLSNQRVDSLDLLMTLHPSAVHFYWMLSRSMFEVERARVQHMKTFQLVEEWYSTWNQTVRFYVTEAILNVSQDGGLDVEGNPLVYVDDILPPATARHDEQDKERPMGNDRVFATACAANSLLAAWTVYDAQGQLLFLPETPTDVVLATKGLVNYVLSQCLSEELSPLNVLQSSLYKHCQTLPCRFPSNSVVTMNGTAFNGSQLTPDILLGMRGQVSPEQYDAMWSESRCGAKREDSPLPTENSVGAPFFFWSAPAYTQALCLLAVSQVKNLKGQADSMEDIMASFLHNT